LTETLDVIKLAQTSGYTWMVSHWSDEIEDTTISYLTITSIYDKLNMVLL